MPVKPKNGFLIVQWKTNPKKEYKVREVLGWGLRCLGLGILAYLRLFWKFQRKSEFIFYECCRLCPEYANRNKHCFFVRGKSGSFVSSTGDVGLCYQAQLLLSCAQRQRAYWTIFIIHHTYKGFGRQGIIYSIQVYVVLWREWDWGGFGEIRRCLVVSQLRRVEMTQEWT